MRRGALAAGVLAAVVVVGAVGAYLYFFSGLRTAPKPLALASPTASATPSAAASPSGTLDGSWSVGQGSQAGYRVREQFVGQSSPHEAVARTSAVSGGLTVEEVAGALKATNLDFTAQLGSLQSVDSVAGYNVSQRDRFVSRSLDTQQYPSATFKAASVDLPAAAASGQQVSLSVPGQLTIHGVTKDVTAAVQAHLNGSQLQVAGSVPTTMTDFGVTAPQVPFTTAEPGVTIEFQLVLSKGA